MVNAIIKDDDPPTNEEVDLATTQLNRLLASRKRTVIPAEKVRKIIPDMPAGENGTGGPLWGAIVKRFAAGRWKIKLTECQPGSGADDQVIFS